MEQRTAEWLEFRKSKIGSSDAPVIMGVSPWKTPLQLWEEKCRPPSNVQENAAIVRGIELEPEALAKFEELTGYLMSPKVLTHPSLDWMIASLDGMDIDGKAIVEIKCPGRIDHECALDGQVPEKYIPQLQHQLEVTGLSKIYYFSYNPSSFKLIEIEKDEKYVKNLLKKEKEFFEFLSKKESPPLSDRDFSELESPEWISLSNQWKITTQKLDELEKEQTRIKEELIQLANQRSAKGNGISISKIIRRGNVDYNAIPELKKIDLERYRKSPIESWRISTTKVVNFH